MKQITIDVSNEQMAREVAHGIMRRAQDIHEQPGDDFEDVAIELRGTAQDLLEEYPSE